MTIKCSKIFVNSRNLVTVTLKYELKILSGEPIDDTYEGCYAFVSTIELG